MWLKSFVYYFLWFLETLEQQEKEGSSSGVPKVVDPFSGEFVEPDDVPPEGMVVLCIAYN